jgi:DNA invertase Pin-like site-specific DNA recombinase
MRPAYGYVRVSGLGQAQDEKDGLIRQKDAIRHYAALNGFRIVKWFEDKISGKTDLENRPALCALRTALTEDGVRTVLIERLDRLARDLMVQEAIIADLQRHNFELISVLEPDMSSSDPTRKLLRQMLGAFSEYERSMIVLKLQGARQRIRAKNPDYAEGRKPYGYRPGEANIIYRARELRNAGYTLTRIAKTLEAEGYGTRYGGRWHAKQISRIIAA